MNFFSCHSCNTTLSELLESFGILTKQIMKGLRVITRTVTKLSGIANKVQFLSADKFAEIIHRSQHHEIIFESSDFTYFELISEIGVHYMAVQGHISCEVLMVINSFQ